MGRDFYGIEKGLDIYAENGALQARILTGTAVPDGLLDQSDAPIGSLYLRSGTGTMYQKIANVGTSTDWELNGASSAQIGLWRPETVIAVTSETLSVGARDLSTTPFTDDNSANLTAADFVVGDHVIGGSDTTPILYKITAVSSPSITLALADKSLVKDDTFLIDHFLPDPSTLENKAIVNFNGSVVVKISDMDWSIATGINLSGAYAAASGNVIAGDSLESAVAKLDGVNDAQDTLLGTAQGATTLGTWSSPVDLLFSATSSVKGLFQRIGDLLMQFRGVQVTGVTAITTIDSVPVATVKAVKWLVTAFEVATPANSIAFVVYAMNNTVTADDTIYAKLKLGALLNCVTTVDVSAGQMRLRCSSSSGGITITARRIEVVKSVL